MNTNNTQGELKILVVDDELVSRKKMQKILEQLGECESVERGTDAITEFALALETGLPFDLISLDISMPDMDGIEVLSNIRSIETKNNVSSENAVKVMMVTAHSDTEKVVGSLKAGCNNYIVKPFDKERVLGKIASLGFKLP